MFIDSYAVKCPAGPTSLHDKRFSFLAFVSNYFKFGGNISLYSELCEQTRRDAYELMIQHAEQKGANAVLAFRYDATEIASGVTEVLAYGTAVLVEKIG
jgi:uncharacterized protein YbjQ (UPF0145 family)